MVKGVVFHIKRFAVHDGPGIRTTLFIKGCPLNCLWCHNPESWSFSRDLGRDPEKCLLCLECVRACSTGALKFDGKSIEFRNTLCRFRGDCVRACPKGAREIIGNNVTVREILDELLKDRVFFEESGGGVTLSGGEPLAQFDFSRGILKACSEKGIHTALDTCGYAPFSCFEKLSPYTDLILYDLKIMNESDHLKYTGKSNKTILSNLVLLSQRGMKTVVRIPVLPGINDSEDSIDDFIRFLSNLNFRQVCLLPYHAYGENKYYRLGMEKNMKRLRPPQPEVLDRIKLRFEKNGFQVKIGG